MRKKVLSVALAVVFGTCLLGKTVQAAGNTLQNICMHDWSLKDRNITYCAEMPYLLHTVLAEDRECRICGMIWHVGQEYTEEHRLELPSVGHVWFCIYCDYTEEILC